MKIKVVSLPNTFNFGGVMSTHGADWSGNLAFINAGGTHESNPNEGVPAGKDENGTPNLVEEGEVIWDNEYVFSNRLKVPQKLRNKYKLGGPITYADAIKKLTKESEDRKNDPISNATNKAIVNEFIDSQEEVRAKKQQRAAERLQQAQYENELLNAIAGLGAEQAPIGPVDMQMPAQEVPQEVPIVEQMGAYGGNLFAGGGPKKKNGAWYVTDPNSGVELRFATEAAAQSAYDRRHPEESSGISTKSNEPSLWNRLTARQTNVESTTRQNKDDSISENPYVEYFLEGIGAYTDDVDSVLRSELRSRTEKVYNRAKRKYEEGSIAYNRAVNNGLEEIIDYLQEREIDSKRVQNEYNAALKRGMGINAASDYLRQLGYKNINYAPKDLTQAERATYQALLTGEYKNATDYYNKKEASQASPLTQAQTSIESSAEETQVPDSDIAIKVEQERQAPPPPPPTQDPNAGRGNGNQGSSSGKLWHDKSLTKEQAYEFEHQSYYQEFLAEMSKNPELANEWRQRLNKGEFGSLNGYVIPDYKDWEDKATDKLVGHIHNATLKAAQEWGKRQPFNHPGKINNGLEDAFNGNVPQRATTDTIGLLGERPISPRPDVSGNTTKSKSTFDWRREAPILGAAAQSLFGLFGEPDYSEADAVLEAANRLGSPISIPVETIGDYVRRRPFDERYLVNMANQNRAAAERGAANTAGGNRAMQLGADAFLAHSNQQELGEIMRQAYLANRQDELSTAEFNRGTNLQNMSAINSRNLAQAQLNTQREQAGFNGTLYGRNMRQNIYDRDVATTGANLSNLFNNLSIRSKEASMDNTIQSMVDEGYFTYGYNPDGTLYYSPTDKLKAALGNYKRGGNLKKKRRF